MIRSHHRMGLTWRLMSLSFASIIAFAASPALAQREVAYDDGTPERNMVWNEAGNGLAVRFSVERGSILLGARFCTGWSPFLNPLGICVLDANGPGGSPGDTLMSYYVEPLHARLGWQGVAFRVPLPIASGEFYIVYLQTGYWNGDATPIALDTSNPGTGRSWIFESHIWSPLAPTSGNAMIRAILSSEVPVVPVTWSDIKAQYREPTR